MKALICGAGVGGLSAAIGLARIGCEVQVFEKSDTLRSTGAGLNLWPNAVRAIYALGLREQYDSISVKLNHYVGYAPDGALLFDKDTSNWPEKYGAPATGVYRKALNEMLAEAVGMDRIKFGYELISAYNEGNKAICKFSNDEVHSADLVVGADGIYSTVRQRLIGDVAFKRNEHHAYRLRALISLSDVDVDPAAQTAYYDPHSFLAVIPIGDGMAYWFGSVTGATSIDDFVNHFSSWTNTHIPNTLRITPRETIIENALYDIETRPDKWSYGRIVLLGDAAHAMMPDMAQGASQTFIDSQVLSEVLSRNSDIEAALNEYERIRKPVAYHVVDRSRRGSYLGAHVVDPIAVRYEKEIEGVAA